MSRLAWNRNVTAPCLALGCSAAFLLFVTGCGGSGGKSDEAVVTPSEPLSTASTAAPAAPASEAATSPTAAAPAAGESTPEAGSSGEGWGTLKGRVVFDGTPPEPKSIDTSAKDPTVCAKSPHKSERLVVDSESKGVRFAIVYIPKPTKVSPEAKSSAAETSVDFDQKECTYEPHVIAVMKGGKIQLKSSDPINHNIDAKLRVNAIFNSILQPNSKAEYSPRAAERGPIEVTCDIHPWMKAYWLVSDSPYFAVTDEKGNFEIKNVPAGGQKLVVWQEAANYVTPAAGQSVTVKANETTTLPDFKIEPGKIKGD